MRWGGFPTREKRQLVAVGDVAQSKNLIEASSKLSTAAKRSTVFAVAPSGVTTATNVALLNASNTFTGTTNTFSGTTVYVNSVLKLKTGTWHVDGDGNSRMYWQSSGPTYLRGHGSGAAVMVRNASDADIGQWNHNGTFIIYNSTATTGQSRLYVKAGAGQTTDLFQTQSNSNAVKVRVDSVFNLVVGDAALATNATGGFLFIPSCAGTPTGTPTTYTGRIAMVYDSTNDYLYVYNGSWKKTTVFA